MSNESFTHYLSKQLQEIERDWKLDPARLEMIRRAVQSKIDLAESILSNAGGAVPLFRDSENSEQLVHFDFALSEAERYLTNARQEYTLIKGESYQRQQAEKAKQRWAEVGQITDEVTRLATRPEYQEDEPRDLWPHLFARLEEMQLEPREVGSGAEKAYIFNGGKVTYHAFRKQVSRARA